MSMFIVPAETPGIEIIRNAGLGGEREGNASHGYVRFSDVRVPADHVLGGQAFVIAQTRLGGGRIHRAMRTVARVRKAFDIMCERALSRQTRKGPLASLAAVQEQTADSWIEIEQFRLLVLRTAWLIGQYNDYKKAQGLRGGEGRDAEGAARRREAGCPPARRPRRLERVAVVAESGRAAGLLRCGGSAGAMH
jgi:acyl-CoA dehydrogenase